MPYKDPAKHREWNRKQMRQWRKRHHCLTRAEIAERLEQLGGSSQTMSEIETLSLSDPRVERYVYQSWLREAS